MQLDKCKKFTFEISTQDNAPHNFPVYKNIYSKMARIALFKILKSIKKSPSFDDLQISNHCTLTTIPNYKVSLSHTKKAACAIVTDDANIKSIGVDIEWATRVVKPGIEKFFLNDKDTQELTKLEIWMAKEAIFKAISPLYQGEKVLVLKDITVQLNSFKCFDFSGEFFFSIKKFDNRELKIATAWI